VVLVGALALVLGPRRDVPRRLLAAGSRFAPALVATGTGLAEATSVVGRVVDRALVAGDDQSVAEARLTAALRMLPQGVVLFGPDGSILFRNKVAKSYLSARHGDALVEEAIYEVAETVIATGGSA